MHIPGVTCKWLFPWPPPSRGGKETIVVCDECRRPVARLLEDGALRIESRHGGKRHVTIVPRGKLIEQGGQEGGRSPKSNRPPYKAEEIGGGLAGY